MKVFYTAPPSLVASKIIWPVQQGQQFTSKQPNLVVTVNIQYSILISLISTAIIEWNIGLPISSQIRQTSADRTDFAY